LMASFRGFRPDAALSRAHPEATRAKGPENSEARLWVTRHR